MEERLMMSSSVMNDEKKVVMNSPKTSSETTGERVSEREGRVVDRETWKEASPLELRYLHSVFNNKRLVLCAQVLYVIVTPLFIYITAYHKTNDVPLSLIVLFGLQGLMMTILPFMCYYFFKRALSCPDFNALIQFGLCNDSWTKRKFSIVTHMNFAMLLFAMIFFGLDSRGFSLSDIVVVFLISILYLFPLISAGSVAIFLVELHRIRMQHFRTFVNERREHIDARLWSEQFEILRKVDHDSNMGDRQVELTARSSSAAGNMKSEQANSSITADNCNVSELQARYYIMYAVCLRTSQKFGLYFLFYIVFGCLYAFTAIYGSYLGQYPTFGVIGFVLVGLFVAFGLGGSLTACNETGE